MFGVRTEISTYNMGNLKTEYDNIMRCSKNMVSQPFSDSITLNLGTLNYHKSKKSENVLLMSYCTIFN